MPVRARECTSMPFPSSYRNPLASDVHKASQSQQTSYPHSENHLADLKPCDDHHLSSSLLQIRCSAPPLKHCTRHNTTEKMLIANDSLREQIVHRLGVQ